MKEFSYFLLQMTSPEDILAAKRLELSLRGVDNPSDFDNKISQLESRYPEHMARSWVKPLLKSIRPSRTTDEDVLTAFLSKMVRVLNGGSPLWGKKEITLNLDNLCISLREAPHMKWCQRLVERYNQLLEANTNPSHIMRLCQVHPSDNITDEQALALSKMYVDDEHSMYMTFPQFIGTYVKSRAKFLVENEQLQPELAEQMADTLRAWQRMGTKVDDYVYWLGRNYEFHWFHHPFLRTFIIQTLELNDSAPSATA